MSAERIKFIDDWSSKEDIRVAVTAVRTAKRVVECRIIESGRIGYFAIVPSSGNESNR